MIDHASLSPLLLIEDSASDARLLLESLIDQGWERNEVWSVSTLRAAREAVLDATFATILLDLTLPDANGLEGVAVMAAAVPDVPIVVITGRDADALVLGALAAGADEFVTKADFAGNTIGSAIRRAVERRRGKATPSDGAALRAFDALEAPTAVLDGSGRILSVNVAWQSVAENANVPFMAVGPGVSYLQVCDVAIGAFAEGASEAATGIRDVLAGRAKHFILDYPCPSEGEDHWFSMRVSNVGPHGGGAVVTHLDISALKAAEERLQRTGERLAGIVDESFPIFALIDGTGTVQHVSEETSNLLGLGPDQDVGSSGFARLDPLDVPAAEAALAGAMRAPGVQQVLKVRAKDGRGRWRNLDLAVVNMLDDERVGSIVVMGSDVTAGRRAQIRGRLESGLLKRLPAAVIVTDDRGVVVYWNDRAEDMYGYTATEAQGRPIVELNVGPSGREQAEEMMSSVSRGDRWEGEYDARRADGSMVSIYATLEVISDLEIGFEGIVGASIDISDRRQLQADIAFAAMHDTLTSLPNRRLFVDHLESALARSTRQGTITAVLSLDIDRFKSLNDRVGRDAGDAVIRTVAEFLEVLVPEGDLVARLGGDEFLVCFENVEGAVEAVAVAERLLQALRAPFRIGGEELVVSASIGVAISGPRTHPEELIRNADAAMYAAKEAGRSRVELFDDDLHDVVRRRHRTALDLAIGLDEGHFEVHYQPEISLATGELAGFEALVRWRHPERGLVPPDEFIGVAEESGLIGRLGCFVLEEACAALGSWLELAPERALTVAVNVSAQQLADRGFPEVVRATLADTAVPAARLCLEVTESALLDTDVADEALRTLKQIGVLIAIDDFGTGYSSLSRLKRSPVDFLKIDRSFVGGIGIDPEDDVIVTTVSSLAHSLGLEVVAEGIETTEQLQRLAQLGCQLGQGYLWERAVPRDVATELVHTRPDGWHNAPSTPDQTTTPASSEPIDARAAVALLAHELAGPLTALVGYAQLLVELDDPARQAKAVRAIERNSRLARASLSLVSDVAALDDGTLRLDRQVLDLEEVVADAIDLTMAKAGPEVEFDVDVATTVLTGDADRMVAALANILSNARKYSPHGARVRVFSETSADHALLHVVDAGPGVPSDRVGHIFRKFGRADRDRVGSGLGLFLARGIARAHGGELAYRQTPQGGADFVFRFPLSTDS